VRIVQGIVRTATLINLAISCLVYHNNGDGTFKERFEGLRYRIISRQGAGIAINDFDRDGWPDILVANDSFHSNSLKIITTDILGSGARIRPRLRSGWKNFRGNGSGLRRL